MKYQIIQFLWSQIIIFLSLHVKSKDFFKFRVVIKILNDRPKKF